MNEKSATTLSTSEMQLRLALALVILGFEERVDKQTRELLDVEQAMHQLEKQREALLEQRKRDTDYLAASMRQLYPDLSLTLSEEGRVEIPSEVLLQLQHLQQGQQQSLLEPPGQHAGEHVADSDAPPVEQAAPRHVPQWPVSSPILADEISKETDMDPRAKAVLVYLFSEPQALDLDWRTTIQRALDLPDPPKMRGHAVYKAMLQAYHILESLHDGTLLHPSDSLMQFYTQYFIEGERWGDLKDTMNEWGIA
ncbi:MAG TPA: hypothetical protein VKR06_25045 [Ktedonosporobacter sp.]|nr:hypothetical protein [Ktedonosporobacter sp.]